MVSIYDILPIELLDSTLAFLPLPDLEAFALTSKYSREVAQNRLQIQRDLFRRASTFKVDGFCELGPVPWLAPVIQVLREPFFGTYIQKLDTDVFAADRTLEVCLKERLGSTRRDFVPDSDWSLLLRAAQRCFTDWFDLPEAPSYREAFFNSVENLESSALLAVLACHLPNLRVLTLTTECYGGMVDLPWFLGLAQRIHVRPDGPLLGCQPFARLEHLKGDSYNGFYGLDFQCIAPFIALPSVRWLETPQNHEEGFDWPPYLPRSNIREIVLDGSSIPEDVIREFAADALKGPCVIRQAWSVRRDGETPEPTWNRLEIPFEGAKAEDHIVEFRQDRDPYMVPFGDIWYSKIGWEVKGGGSLLGNRPVLDVDGGSWLTPEY
ncbi:unnamed protein product [Clonostachys rhizophaga]|uniref:F-box domain-containing protein n=1 Tax=Clonostachys rhizophaga TaxID=160324 RepID=A0A9N9VKE2_9HYPO|nr:unnamed protein product [Clonostachys rhizophaga]